MNNKYDIELTQDEAKELANNVSMITDFCKDLVKHYGTQAMLVAEWTYYDRVWGKRTCKVEIEKGFTYKENHEKDWFTKVWAKIGGLSGLEFDETFTYEKLLKYSTEREYALSLIDNWKVIKHELEAQHKQREETRQTIKEFEL